MFEILRFVNYNHRYQYLKSVLYETLCIVVICSVINHVYFVGNHTQGYSVSQPTGSQFKGYTSVQKVFLSSYNKYRLRSNV
jgi:hypothetical protein